MVNSTAVTISYTSDGVTTAYSVPFYFMSFNDLVVQSTVNGVVTSLVNGVDWLGTGTPNLYGGFPNGGTITFQPGKIPSAGATITITRATTRKQPDTYLDNSPFPAIIVESDFDRLTLITQELLTGFIGILPGPPTSGNYVQGQWFISSNFVAGGNFGGVCTASGNPGTWNPFGLISL